MDFSLSEKQQQFQASVHQFAGIGDNSAQ